MFTGIITALGTVRALTPIGGGHDMRVEIAAPGEWIGGQDVPMIPLGASIACSGCCLTAIAVDASGFAAEVSGETLSRTTLGTWRVGTRVNLERSLKLGDEMGGHIVSGHVDGVGEAIEAVPDEGSTRWRFRVAPGLARLIAVKGSVAVDGVSLTVNVADDDGFAVNIIPHTASVTGFATLRPGDRVNIEIDMLARYVARLVGPSLIGQ
jgi:riboflavin synthase